LLEGDVSLYLGDGERPAVLDERDGESPEG
jgi:hypothetical protein